MSTELTSEVAEDVSVESGNTLLSSEPTDMGEQPVENDNPSDAVDNNKVEEAENGEEKKEEAKAEGDKTLETYKDLSLPEKAEMPEGYLDSVKQFALDNDLSVEQATAVVNHVVEQGKNIAEYFAQRISDDLEARKEEWEKQIKSNSDYPNVIADARKSLSLIQDMNPQVHKDFVEVLEVTRLGSHPAVVSALKCFGEMLKEPELLKGKVVAGDGSKNQSDGKVMFPYMN